MNQINPGASAPVSEFVEWDDEVMGLGRRWQVDVEAEGLGVGGAEGHHQVLGVAHRSHVEGVVAHAHALDANLGHPPGGSLAMPTRIASALLVLMTPVVAQLSLDRQIDSMTAERWLTELIPHERELSWLEVDWIPSFGEAVVRARDERRPLLFWAMNGHPLGCT